MNSRIAFLELMRVGPMDLARACLLLACEEDPELDVDAALTVLDAHAAAARPLVPPGCTAVQAAEGLRVALGERAGFAGFAQDYDDVRSSLLHEVLRRQRGLPLLLSVVWLEVAQRLGVRAWAVGLPGHLIVGIGDPDGDHVHVDPYAGGRRVAPDLLRDTDPSFLLPMTAHQVLLRLLANVRALTLRQPPGLAATARRLWATEMSLLVPHHPVDLRRERGELLVRLGHHELGAESLEMWAEAVEGVNPDGATKARRDARMARAQLN